MICKSGAASRSFCLLHCGCGCSNGSSSVARLLSYVVAFLYCTLQLSFYRGDLIIVHTIWIIGAALCLAQSLLSLRYRLHRSLTFLCKCFNALCRFRRRPCFRFKLWILIIASSFLQTRRLQGRVSLRCLLRYRLKFLKTNFCQFIFHIGLFQRVLLINKVCEFLKSILYFISLDF